MAADGSPVSHLQCQNLIPGRILKLGKPMSDSNSDSSSEIDIVLEEPMIPEAHEKVNDNRK